jgi:hypothetical protein
MIGLGLRLSVGGGRQSLARLAITAAAVALGVGMLLVTLAGINAVRAQDVRIAWMATSEHNTRPSVDEATTDPLWATGILDQYGSRAITRIDVAATGPRSPVPPGITRLPGAGEYYASPALTRLLAATPADQLGDRYPGHQIGTIADSALASPESLTIIVGHRADELAGTPGAIEVRSIEMAPHESSPFNPHPGRIQLILAVAAGALLFPVLVFVMTASRLAAAQREQRFAAMRLVGATPRQVSAIAAIEAALAAAIGTAGGFLLFLLLRQPMARVPFAGEPFFPADLSLTRANVLLVALGIPIAAAVVARLALRRVHISPLGVRHQVTTEPPSAWRLVPLLVGVVELAYFAVVGRPRTTGQQINAYGAGFLLAMLGLLIAGPWLTMTGSRLLAGRANHPAALIASRRLSDNPRGAFRSVSGLIVALFITTSALGVINTIVSYHDASTGGSAGRRLVAQDFLPHPLDDVPREVVSTLNAIPGVRGVAVVHTATSTPVTESRVNGSGPVLDLGPPLGLVLCTDLAHIPALGHCPSGVDVATMPYLGGGTSTNGRSELDADTVRPAFSVPASHVDELPVRSLYIDTDGTTAAIERVRTALETSLPRNQDTVLAPSTLSDISPEVQQQLTGYETLAAVAIIASLPIAACSLAVSVAVGLIDRKRPFSLLRLAGTPLKVLRRVVGFESAVPLLAVSALAIGTGLIAADLFLHAQLNESLRPPGTAYYAAVTAAVVIALGIIAATLPLLERITGPDTARNE